MTLTLFALCACGGKARVSDESSFAGQGGSGSAAGAATTSAGSSTGPSGATSFILDDAFPWFNGAGDSEFSTGDQNHILHIVADQAPSRATLSTHNLVNLLSQFDTVRFSARASAPTRMLVSAGRQMQGYDYFAAREAGMPWPVAPVDVGVGWKSFSVLVSAMQPPEVATRQDGPFFFLAFVLEHPDPVEIWLDDVQFE